MVFIRKNSLLFSLLFLLFSSFLFTITKSHQQFTQIYAGSLYSGSDIDVLATRIKTPTGLAGIGTNLFYSDAGNCIIRRMSFDTGKVYDVAGNNVCGYNNDGKKGPLTSLGQVAHIFVDSNAVLYWTEVDNQIVRKMDSNNIVVTIAGSFGSSTIIDDVPATSSGLVYPNSVWGDSLGNIYIADSTASRIRKVNGSHIITTYAGNGVPDLLGAAAAATSAGIGLPTDIDGDTAGNLYIIDAQYGTLLQVDANGVLTTLVDPSTRLGQPQGVFYNSVDDCVYIADPGASQLFIWCSYGRFDAIAGNGQEGMSVNSVPALSSPLGKPLDVFLPDGSYIYFTQSSTQIISYFVEPYPISKVIGVGSSFTGDGGWKEAAVLASPRNMWRDSSGILYFPEYDSKNIRYILPNGIIDTLPGLTISLETPFGIWGDNNGTLYVSDQGASVLYKIKLKTTEIKVQNSIIYAGVYRTSGSCPQDGAATDAFLLLAGSVWVDTVGTVYLADGFCGLNRIELNGLLFNYGLGLQGMGLWGNNAGLLFYANYYTNKIYTIDLSNYQTSLIAGSDTGLKVWNGTISATEASFNNPMTITGDSNGNIYIGDTNNYYVRKLTQNGLGSYDIVTIAGDGFWASTATLKMSGPATSIRMGYCEGLFTESNGDLLFSDDAGIIRSIYTVDDPTSVPSGQPSKQPSSVPTTRPSALPSGQPSSQPTRQPSRQPTSRPSSHPSTHPSSQPSLFPTVQPSSQPISQPSSQPSRQPSSRPTRCPSAIPSSQPSSQPSRQPSSRPTRSPSAIPSSQPSSQPSTQPSSRPTRCPSAIPSSQPSSQPSRQPSSRPTRCPSTIPSSQPSSQPSTQPTTRPSMHPSSIPTNCPSTQPSNQPTLSPSSPPSSHPSSQPTSQPSILPTSQPTITPTACPSYSPTSKPSLQPTSKPSSLPTRHPYSPPTSEPSSQPSLSPSSSPSSLPSMEPSSLPSIFPSSEPTTQPSSLPSTSPSGQPSSSPSERRTSSPSLSTTPSPSLTATNPSTFPSASPSISPTMIPTQIPSFSTTSTITITTIAPTISPASVSPSDTTAPSIEPSIQPSILPSVIPTRSPTTTPTRSPTAIQTTSPTPFPTSSLPSMAPSMSSRPSSFSPMNSPVITLKPTNVPTSAPTLPAFSIYTVNSTVPRLKEVLFFMGSQRYTTTLQAVAPVVVGTEARLGENYIILGGKTIPAIIDMTNADDDSSFNSYVALNYGLSQDGITRSLSVVKDVNGDGVRDVMIGDPIGGRVYVLYGNPTLSGSNRWKELKTGFTMSSSTSYDYFGWSVSEAGDFNGDGIGDMIVGAIQANRCYLIYGKEEEAAAAVGAGSGMKSRSVFELDASSGLVISGSSAIIRTLGLSVSGGGDVNGDGFDDVVMSALMSSGSSMQSVIYVLYGGVSMASRGSIAIEGGVVVGSEGLKIVGAGWSFAGVSVSLVGDVNGDGLDDVAIGSTPYSQGYSTQVSYVVYGRNSSGANTTHSRTSSSSSSDLPSTISLSSMSVGDGVRIIGGGFIVSRIGDVNNDGFEDVMVSRYDDWQGKSASYMVVFPDVGSVSSFPTLSPSAGPPTFAPSSTSPPSQAPSPATAEPSTTPTFSPSGPSVAPTAEPSAPSSKPTPTPSTPPFATTSSPSYRPSLTPSVNPSRSPVKKPVKTALPTISPSCFPTRKPLSASPPSSRTPSYAPTVRPSRTPTVRGSSTAAPSKEMNVTYIRRAGSYYPEIGSEDQMIVVSSQGSVKIEIQSKNDGSERGKVRYKIFPLEKESEEEMIMKIVSFDGELDVIDLTAFDSFRDMSEISYSTEPLKLLLSKSQSVVLQSHDMFDLSEKNFLFGSTSSSSSSSSSSNEVDYLSYVMSSSFLVPIIVFVSVAFSIALWAARNNSYSLDRKHVFRDFPSLPVARTPSGDHIVNVNIVLNEEVGGVMNQKERGREEEEDERSSSAFDSAWSWKSFDSFNSFISPHPHHQQDVDKEEKIHKRRRRRSRPIEGSNNDDDDDDDDDEKSDSDKEKAPHELRNRSSTLLSHTSLGSLPSRHRLFSEISVLSSMEGETIGRRDRLESDTIMISRESLISHLSLSSEKLIGGHDSWKEVVNMDSESSIESEMFDEWMMSPSQWTSSRRTTERSFINTIN